MRTSCPGSFFHLLNKFVVSIQLFVITKVLISFTVIGSLSPPSVETLLFGQTARILVSGNDFIDSDNYTCQLGNSTYPATRLDSSALSCDISVPSQTTVSLPFEIQESGIRYNTNPVSFLIYSNLLSAVTTHFIY